MNKPHRKTSLFLKALRRTGGWYLAFAIVLTQIFSSFGAIAANYSIHVNAEFTPSEQKALTLFAIATFSAAYLLALFFVYVLYRDVRKELDEWKRDESKTPSSPQIWNKITVLAWRYSSTLFIVSILIVGIPVVIFENFVLKVTTDQIIYTLLGSLAAILSNSVLSLLFLDYFLKPTYQVLHPQGSSIEEYTKIRGLNLSAKLQSITLALILTSVLLIAPIGYHQTIKALETGDKSVLRAIQVQSLVVGILIILFGILVSALFAQSVSRPIRQLIQTFGRIESGDLKARANVMAPDEIGELAIYFNSMVSRLDELQGSLETQIEMRTEQLMATAEVGRVVSSILEPKQLMEEVVNLITERLGYYYAAIFIISPDGHWAELKSATGEAGQELLARRHRLSLSGRNMVGAAINLRKARIAHDVGTEAIRFDNPLLPLTRSEIALPLIAGGRVLGALDAQSTEENAFAEGNAEILQGMANQVAIALENARLFQETQQALNEIRAGQKTRLSKAWSETLDARGALEISVGEEPLSNAETLNVPLALRDQIIGEITLEGEKDWTPDEQGWVEAVATQAALALENARLLEESQQIALQERLIAEITGKIWSSNTTDGILKIAIKELGSTLGASEAIIQLDIDQDEPQEQ
jgi:GAF domain-containing protein/HAMP domain-containing protein